jgi:two-component system, cell cycle sensor histidine kinase and response regulator CckA
MREISGTSLRIGLQRTERREWWLWATAVLVTLLLTLGILSFVFPMARESFDVTQGSTLSVALRGLAGLVLLFDIFTVYQQLQISRIRRRLAEREELFRLISENAADMIAVVDSRGERVYNSPAYEKVLGYTQEDLEQTSSLDQVHPEDRNKVVQASREAQQSGEGRRIEYRMRHKNGNWISLESTASVVRNSKGEVDKFVIVNRDITRRKQLELQFHQAQKMEAVGRLSGGVAHDFNNLLGVIIGYSEFLQETVKEPEQVRVSIDEILKSGKRAASLTRQLLAFSRQQVLDLRVLDLNAVVADMEKMLRRLIGEDIELSTKLEPSLGRVKADQGQIEQVIMNLAVNSRDAMPSGGKLTIEARNFEMDEAFVRKYPYPVQTGSYILLSVSDTGCGMDAATQAHIFEPFFTTKEKGKGTGLGLSMVYGVVKQSGGYIDVASETGVGTTFLIYLPRVQDVIETDRPRSGPVSRATGSETVLVVEDEVSLRTLTVDVLRQAGYTVLQANTGAEALEVSEAHQGAIGLLLTDVVMPGMSGRELAERLSPVRPAMKVLYMSGYTGQTIGERAVLDPGSLFLQKPFTREVLRDKVREALEAHPAAVKS